MLKIHKYKIDKAFHVWLSVEMPWGAKILSFQEQNGDLCIWALVDDTKAMGYKTFMLHGTGISFSDSKLTDYPVNFIGTAQSDGYVWHLFERTSSKPLTGANNG